MSVRQRVPDPLATPLSLVSLTVTVLGAVLGYIFLILGATLYFDLNGLPLTGTESLIVVGTGVVCLVVGYVGWRGFITFAR